MKQIFSPDKAYILCGYNCTDSSCSVEDTTASVEVLDTSSGWQRDPFQMIGTDEWLQVAIIDNDLGCKNYDSCI